MQTRPQIALITGNSGVLVQGDVADVEAAEHDVHLLRAFKGPPKLVNIHGYLFNIDDETLTLVVEDRMTREK